MADRGCKFSSFHNIHVRLDKKIDISFFIRPMIIKFGKQIHLHDLTQMRLITQMLVASLRQNHVIN